MIHITNNLPSDMPNEDELEAALLDVAREGMKQKRARIRIPFEKQQEALAVLNKIRSSELIAKGGKASLCIYQDDEAFIKNELIMDMNGDHCIVEPAIHAIMTVLNS